MSMQSGSIDPRTLKELLQLQTLNKVNLLSSGPAANANASDSDFSEMLQELLAVDSSQAPASERTTSQNRLLQKANLVYQAQLAHAPGKPTDYEEAIQTASRKFGVEPSLVKAVIDAESSFNPRAVSGAGAKGLMQLMDSTREELGVTNPFDPEQNINGGTRYLSDLIMKYKGNTSVALAAYNAGSGRVDRLGIRTDGDLQAKLHLLPAETQSYVRKVKQLQQGYQA